MIVDEYARYINPDVEMFLSVAASSRVAGIFAIQSLGQLEIESGRIGAKAMKQAIMTNCRSKIAFCGLSSADAKEFAEEFGKDVVIIRQSTYKNKILMPKFFPESYRDTETEEYRYRPTYLQDQMKRFHFICKILNDGTPQKPIEGVGAFVPQQRSWEQPINQPIQEENRGFIKKLFSQNFSRETKVLSTQSAIFSVNPDKEGSREFVEENAILLGQNKQAVVRQAPVQEEIQSKLQEVTQQELVKQDNNLEVFSTIEQVEVSKKVVPASVLKIEKATADDSGSTDSSKFVVSDDEAYENGDTFF